MHIDIRPPGVISAGQELQLRADSAKTSLGPSLDTSKSAASAHPGWRSSGPLADCAQAWENYLGDLVGQLNQLGQLLISSGEDYTAADQEAERRMLEVLELMSGS